MLPNCMSIRMAGLSFGWMGTMRSTSSARLGEGGRRARQQARRSIPPRPFSLLRWFSVASFTAIVAVGISVTWFLTNYLTSQMLLRDAEVSRDYIESIIATEKVHEQFSLEEKPPSQQTLAPFVEHLPTLPDLVRANLYARDGTVLWSTDNQLIGRRFDANPELTRALRGEIVLETGLLASDEHKAEHAGLNQKTRADERKHFVEAYLPIRNAGGQEVLAVVEAYKTPRSLFQAIDQGVYIAWASAGFSGLVLYLAFFGIIRRGDKLMRIQRERLIEAETLTAVGEMAAAVAHNIRNPLASIRSAAELAREEDRCGVQDCLNDIMGQADRLDRWVRELILAAHNTGTQLELVDVNRLVQDVLNGAAPEVRRRNIELIFSADRLPYIRGSRAPLGHAIGSVISNAVQATPSGGRLYVETSLAAHKRVQIVVEDSGEGIPPHARRQVFRLFFTTKPNGSGLGLSLARRIIERHSGAIELESALGKGTRVVMSLPAGG